MFTADLTPKLIERFISSVVRGGPDDCWPRMAHVDLSHGHGMFRVGGRRFVSSRIAYEIANNCSVLPQFHVGHLCNTPWCHNPSHLTTQSPLENTHQAIRDGCILRGERASWSKLTDSQVLEIRARYAAGGISQRKLGLEYGVIQNTIKLIVLRRTWTHI